MEGFGRYYSYKLPISLFTQNKMTNDILKKYVNIPNMMTLLRIVVIIPFMIGFLGGNYLTASLMLIISALSDAMDGKIARKLHQKTNLGAILDPIADKLTLAAVVICIGTKFPFTWIFAIMLVLKEILMLAGGIILIKRHIAPPAAAWYGKFSTVVFYASMVIIVGSYAVFDFQNQILITSLMSFTALCMLYALIRYFIVFLDLIKKKNNNQSI